MSIHIKDTAHRFSDIAGEPYVPLLPLDGFKDKPLVTLEEAIKPVENIIPNIAAYVSVAKEGAENPTDDLSVDESASIRLYTMEWEPCTKSLYHVLNTALRNEDRACLRPWFLYLKLLFTALSHLRSVKRTVYRGVCFNNDNDCDRFQEGKKITWWGFSSCSTDRDVCEKEQFLGQTGKKTLFIIDCVKGKDIRRHSYYRKENEILLLPATKFEVLARHTTNQGIQIVHLREHQSSAILLEPVSTDQEIQNLKKNSLVNTASSTLKKLSIGSSDRAVNPALLKEIAGCKPHSQVYRSGKHNDADIEVIVQQLVVGKQCQDLSIREGAISSQGAIIISEALRQSNLLQLLFLSDSHVGDTGAKALADALSFNTKLKELHLGNNGITDESTDDLAEMLKLNRTLTHLHLPSNAITDIGLQQLAAALTGRNKTLRVLSLEWNLFRNDASADALLAMFNANNTLTELNLDSCKLPKETIKKIKTAAKKKSHFELSIQH